MKNDNHQFRRITNPEELKDLQERLESFEEENEEKVDLLLDYVEAVAFRSMNSAFEMCTKAMNLAEKLDYDAGVARSKLNHGIYYFAKSPSNIEKAMQYSLDALEWYENDNNILGTSFAQYTLGMIHWSMGNYETGLKYVYTALEAAEKYEVDDSLGWIYNSLGNFSIDMKNYDEALSYYEKSYDLFAKEKDYSGEGRSLNGIGNALFHLGDIDAALKKHEESLEYFSKGEIPVGSNRLGFSRTLNDIGHIKESQELFEEALCYYNKALKMREEMEYPQGMSTSLLDLGDLHVKLEQFEKAREYLLKSLDICREIKAYPKISRALKALSRVEKAAGNYQESLEYHEQFSELGERVFKDDAENKLKNVRAAFKVEADKKEAEIHRLKNEELAAKNDELEKTLKELNSAQAQLLHSSKMATLGRLTTGIVHEFNTPVGAIRSEADTSKRTYKKIKKIIKSGINGDSKELDKLLDFMNNSLKNSGDATERIEMIVKGLKNFTRIDESQIQLFDINECIKNTLSLMGNEFGEDIKLKIDLSDLPKIPCRPADLNQTFMNIILNAISAIDKNGTISISSEVEDDNIVVSISDNGSGIAEENLDEIFEPGFTEKAHRVRMRTGLYTSHRIVHRHDGEITVKSEIDIGTTFSITLPIHGKSILAEAKK
jgi:two-component system, NtrC family, sensor kinase